MGQHLGKLLGIQYLRAVAALAVVVFHAAGKEDVSFLIGEAGVDVFFVISGFLMVAITNDDTEPKRFATDRLKRIGPLYWIATTVMLCGAIVGLFPNARLDFWHLVASYFFVPAQSPSADFIWPLLVPGWTLNYEMAFYALFAGTLTIKGEFRRIVTLTGIISGAALLGFLLSPDNVFGRFYTNQIILEFVAGCWLGYTWKHHHQLFRQGKFLIILATILFLFIGYLNSDENRALLFGFPAIILVFGVLAKERQSQISRLQVPLLLGNASYSIYIWHTLAISVTSKMALLLTLGTFPTIVLNIIGGVAIGILSYAVLEKPLLRFFKNKKGPVTSIAPS